jgi:O-antigen ligase
VTSADIKLGRAGLFERAFVFSVLLLSTGAFMSLTVAPGEVQETASGQAGMQVLWMVIYLVALVLLTRHCQTALMEVSKEYLAVGLVLLAVVSTLWSDDPSLTLRRSIALVLTCLFGVYLGSRFSFREQLQLLAGVAAVCVAFSVPFGILGVGHPVEDISDAWYGIFVHKNVLGRMMVLSILIFSITANAESKKRLRYWVGTGLAFTLLLLARSTTSLAVLGAMLGFLACCSVLRRPNASMIKASLAVIVISAVAVHWASQNMEDILALFGKDMTLTGRIQLWLLSVVMALQRPWLGHGYNAFWLGPGSTSERILTVVQWDAPHAHNGLLELWLELGVVGVALFLAGFTAYLVRAISFFRAQRAPENVWPLCFLVFMFVSNLTESDFLGRNTIFWIVYIAVVTGLRRREEASERPVLKPAHVPLLRAKPRVCEG